MKIDRHLKAICLTAGLALAAASSQAQTIVSNSFTNTFDAGGNTSPFTGGSVASWIYWYGFGHNNDPMTNDPSMDSATNSTSGSLIVYAPFSKSGGTDQVETMGTINNGGGYDFSVQTPVNIITQISCDIFVPLNAPTNAAGNLYGGFKLFLISAAYSGGTEGGFDALTVPSTAFGHWYHLINGNVTNFNNFALNYTVNTPGVGIHWDDYAGPIAQDGQVWVDNVALTTASAPPPPTPAPTLQSPVNYTSPGYNSIWVSSANQFNREELGVSSTSAGGNVGPADAADVTYTWTISSLPGKTHNNFQAHFFINSDDGNANEADNSSADYNSSNVIFTQVQINPDGSGQFNYRWKTNEGPGNNQLFHNPSDTPSGNGNPFVALTDPQPLGTWTLHFHNTTNVTILGPSGATTNFNMDPAAMAFFTGVPVSIQLGGQANNANDEGLEAVFTGFTLTGPSGAFTSDFVADAIAGGVQPPWSAANPDPGSIQFIAPGTTNLLVQWGKDVNFDLQGNTDLVNGTWNYLTGINPLGASLTKFTFLTNNAVFVTPDTFGADNSPNFTDFSNQVYFRARNDGLYGP